MNNVVISLGTPFSKTNISDFWKLVALMFDQNVQQTFRGEGYRGAGTEAWPIFSPYTLHPVSTLGGTKSIVYDQWNKRPGTDGARTRRYTANSKLLQASGLFKQSFIVQEASEKTILYGTKHKLANEIMSSPTRQVLTVTDRDTQRLAVMAKDFYLRRFRKT